MKEHGAKACLEIVKDFVTQDADVKITKRDDLIDNLDEDDRPKDEPVTFEVVIVKDDREVVMYLDSQQIDEAFHAELD